MESAQFLEINIQRNIMKEILRSNTIILAIGIIAAILTVFWALTINRCLKITSEKLRIEASCNIKSTGILR